MLSTLRERGSKFVTAAMIRFWQFFVGVVLSIIILTHIALPLTAYAEVIEVVRPIEVQVVDKLDLPLPLYPLPIYEPIKPVRKIMSFDPKQFRDLIHRVLKDFATNCGPGKEWIYSEDAVELLMMTAAQETLLGKYIRQVRGPALGVFQMEPGAYNHLFNNYITRGDKEWLHNAYELYISYGASWRDRMMADIPYQIVLARIYYLRYPEPLPSSSDREAMAQYYKRYWNTSLGKATVEEAIARYERYAI